jgi:hypothetical protein
VLKLEDIEGSFSSLEMRCWKELVFPRLRRIGMIDDGNFTVANNTAFRLLEGFDNLEFVIGNINIFGGSF